MTVRGIGRLRAGGGSGSVVYADIALVGFGVGTNAVTLPAHIAGDMFYGFAFRDGGNPTSTPATWNLLSTLAPFIEASAGGSWVRSFLAIDGATANPTFTSATSSAVVALRNVKAPPDDLGGDTTFTPAKSANFTNTSAVYKDPVFTVTDGSSALLAMICSSDPTFTPTPPTGTVLIADQADATSRLCVFLGLGMTGFTQETIALGVTAGWVTATAEIVRGTNLAASALITGTGDTIVDGSGNRIITGV